MKEQNYTPERLRELLSCTLEEPEVVTMKMKEAYETIRANEDGRNTKRKGAYRKAAGFAAAAAAALLVATPVMAKGIGAAWDTVTAAIFGADEKVQQTYEGTGLSQTFEAGQESGALGAAQKADARGQGTDVEAQDTKASGVTRKTGDTGAAQALPSQTIDGVTASLKQVLTDGYILYMSVDVEAPEGMVIDGGCLFDSMNLLVDGKPYEPGGSRALNAGFVEDEYALAPNHRTYEVVCYASNGIDLDGEHLALRLSDFQIDKGKLEMETVVKGVWTLEWDMGAAYHGKTVTIDLAGGACGKYATLKSIDITPLSYSLNYEYSGSDMDLFDDILWVEFIMKDGTHVNVCGDQDSLITGNGGGRSMSCSREGFKKLLDVDEVAGVCIDGVTYSVK